MANDKLRIASEIKAWGEQQAFRRGPKFVDLEEARRAAGFYRMIPLPEGLPVPTDFVIPDPSADKELQALLAGRHHALILLEGDAGVGKSTYISDLYRRLRAERRAVIGHHFWLGSDDVTRDRVTYDAVASALMMQLAENGRCDERVYAYSVLSLLSWRSAFGVGSSQFRRILWLARRRAGPLHAKHFA